MNDDLSHLEAQLADIGIPDVDDVTSLSDAELSFRLNGIRQRLLGLGEMVAPTTDQGRALHSERGALLLEMRRRQSA